MRILLHSLVRSVSKIKSPFRSLSMEAAPAKRIAVCQMTSVADKKKNLEVVSTLVEQAAKQNAEMVFFPEACDYLCDNKRDTVAFAESIRDGATVNSYKELAIKHKIWLSMGGLHEKDPERSSKIYNTHVIINSCGETVQTYRKLHLFDVDLPERRVRLMESDTTLGGQHVVTPVSTPVGNVGMAICYDLRFPELGVQLAGMGAHILTYPSAFTEATGKAHWEVLLRARAIENQCYVVAAAQCGEHNARRRSYGRAVCVSPWGEVLADCGESGAGCALADVTPELINRVRRDMPVFTHRRSDVYCLYTLSLRAAPLPAHAPPLPLSDQSEPPATPPAPADQSQTSAAQDGRTYAFGQTSVPESCVFLKTDYTYAFVNLRCVVPGHVLVAPVRTVKRNEDLTASEAIDFFSTIIKVQKLMERVHDVKSSTINIQDGPDAGQTIWHLHCHIMPRRPKDFRDNDLIYLELAKHDRLTPNCPSKPARSRQEMDEEAAMLRSELEKMRLEETAQKSTT